jgi:hypothetical protein
LQRRESSGERGRVALAHEALRAGIDLARAGARTAVPDAIAPFARSGGDRSAHHISGMEKTNPHLDAACPAISLPRESFGGKLASEAMTVVLPAEPDADSRE